MATNIQDNEAMTSQINEASSILYQAIKDNKLDDIKLLLGDKRLVNAPLFTFGPLAGYTALHVASYEENKDLVKMLVEDESWRDDFGDEITILTYAILYEDSVLADFLLSKKANPRIKNNKNKTLLMSALEKNHDFTGQRIFHNLGDPELINHHDDDGYYTLYYLFHPKKYGDFRYDGERLYTEHNNCMPLANFLLHDPDIYALVNNDPSTLLLNVLAYRSSCMGLRLLLPMHDHLINSKALYYATLPLEDPQKTLCISPGYSEEEQREVLDNNRKKSIEFIVKDLINRISFNLPVPEEEKKLLDRLITTDKDIRELVHNYERDFIHGELKSMIIKYGNQTMTYFDFVFQSRCDRRLRSLMRDDVFIKSYRSLYHDETDDHYYFSRLCLKKNTRARERIKLLDNLKKVQQLKMAIPLPYECVLDIIEYLNNRDLEVFINSFYYFV